jgi:hypothetical protein
VQSRALLWAEFVMTAGRVRLHAGTPVLRHMTSNPTHPIPKQTPSPPPKPRDAPPHPHRPHRHSPRHRQAAGPHAGDRAGALDGGDVVRARQHRHGCAPGADTRVVHTTPFRVLPGTWSPILLLRLGRHLSNNPANKLKQFPQPPQQASRPTAASSSSSSTALCPPSSAPPSTTRTSTSS